MLENNVTEYRENLGLSKQKLSQLTGISPSNIYHIETAKTFAYPGWRKRLADALNTNEENLFPQYERNEKL